MMAAAWLLMTSLGYCDSSLSHARKGRDAWTSAGGAAMANAAAMMAAAAGAQRQTVTWAERRYLLGCCFIFWAAWHPTCT
jgi:hypothetical protein